MAKAKGIHLVNSMKKIATITGALALALPLSACADQATAAVDTSQSSRTNPLLAPSPYPYDFPPFDLIENHHFAPALEAAMAEHRAEVEAIADNVEAPSFENTIVAMEKTGQQLARVMRVFSGLTSAHTNEELQATQREFAPRLAAHRDALLLSPDLFARVEAVYAQRHDLKLDAEAMRLVERYHRQFVRAGAQLSETDQARLREIHSELAQLDIAFTQLVLEEVNDSAVVFEGREWLDGLSEAHIEAAATAAQERGLPEDFYVITLLNTSGQPPLSSMHHRKARERLHRASLARGSRGGEQDTLETVARILALRAERARMLGYATHADYILEEQTAKSVQAVDDLHTQVSPIAVANARSEGARLQKIMDATTEEPFELASWDWAYYAEKARQERYDFDSAEIRPYFELSNVLVHGVFYSAEKLFCITFVERPDLPRYHPDITVWEVLEADGTSLGLFVTDFYARPSKRGGAWMNSYRVHSGLLGGAPVVGNHLNITKPPEGEPTLLTWDEVTTMFHEFGHALHGLFSDVQYPMFAATAVPSDFVEFPSQVYEMWADWPEVLSNYARHYHTDEPIPAEKLERVLEASRFHEGFRTTEYLAASILDMALHRLAPDEVPSADELMAWEERVLAEAGMDYAPVPPRYRIPYFSHSIGGYSASYYSYIWSEVLDADSVEWIRENGGLDRATGDHFRKTILSRGGSQDEMELYLSFVGRKPTMEPLLKRRGLLTDPRERSDGAP